MLMKTTILRWSSVIAAALSATWVILLAAVVLRCKLSAQPFPVLAKFSPFHEHLMLTDRWLTLFPVFALLAVGVGEVPSDDIGGIGVVLGVEGQIIIVKRILPDSPSAACKIDLILSGKSL